MKVAVVGNGPSAEGCGDLIDACDFVVRMKVFWKYAADGAGEKIDAWATFLDDGREYRGSHELWVVQTPKQIFRYDTATERIRDICDAANGQPIRWYTERELHIATQCLEAEPSTGFVAVDMALRRFPDCSLCIFGFDSTVPNAPNWEDAKRHPGGNVSQHSFIEEKRMISRIDEGEWMCQPTKAGLIWENRPEL